MTIDTHDLATRRQALRLRIHNDERALAVAYPDNADRLAQNLERERAQLAELDKNLGDAFEEVRGQLVDAVEAYFDARGTLLKLNGYFQDPGFKDSIFTRPYLSRAPSMGTGDERDTPVGDPLPPEEVRNVLLRVADTRPAPDLTVPEHQRVQDERLRNERAGTGAFTDDELAQKEQDPVRFAHGAGAKLMQRPRMPVKRDA